MRGRGQDPTLQLPPASLPRDEVDCSTLWMELQALAAGPIVIKCIVELLFCSTRRRSARRFEFDTAFAAAGGVDVVTIDAPELGVSAAGAPSVLCQ